MSGLTGRFLSRDPIGYKGSEWSLYEGLEGSNLVSVDPFGETSVKISRESTVTSGCGGGTAQVPFSMDVKEASTKSAYGLVIQKITLLASFNKCNKKDTCCVEEKLEWQYCKSYETFGMIDLAKEGPARVFGFYNQGKGVVNDRWNFNVSGGSCGSKGYLLFAAEVMVVEASREEIQRFLSGFNYNDQVLQCGFLSTNPPPLAEPSTSDAVGKRLDDKIGVIWNCCDGKMEHSSYSSF